MTPRSVSLLAALALCPIAALAQDGPAFDCAKAESSAETLICEDAGLAALDRRLADRFAAALAVSEGLDADAEETTRTLRAMQRGWISGRDECWKEPDLRACIETEYLRREAELVAEFLLDPRQRPSR
ncbi:lysozyme inhibitor LprI family protein [Sulfitobacter porphyrae]|uniref:Lysozyme inhibitor LprI family protein n=1 Tax=Sulfitobacter porphyrae TaxID=1246864 RepID=A0ABW2B4X4_9RHOB